MLKRSRKRRGPKLTPAQWRRLNRAVQRVLNALLHVDPRDLPKTRKRRRR